MFLNLSRPASPNAPQSYRNFSVSECNRTISELKKGTAPFLLLDVRSPDEHAAGHIDGSLLIPVSDLSRRIAEIAAHKNNQVIVYCHSGGRSAMAAQILAAQGFSNVTNMVGGMLDWFQNSLPVKRK